MDTPVVRGGSAHHASTNIPTETALGPRGSGSMAVGDMSDALGSQASDHERPAPIDMAAEGFL